MLPAPRAGTKGEPYRIAVVCLGNICRSPMADVVLNTHLDKADLPCEVTVDSFGTGGWHVGQPMDHRAAATLTHHAYDATRHRAQQFTAATGASYDLVIAMDRDNRSDLLALGVTPERLRLWRSFDPEAHGGDVPDPYYGDRAGFDHVLAIVERGAATIVSQIAALATA